MLLRRASSLGGGLQRPSGVRRSPGTCKSPLRAVAGAASDSEEEREWGRYVLSNGLVDYYEVLGVDDDASPREVKRAYRALAKECHPDYHPDGHNICILLNEAYEVLSDDEGRNQYDGKLEAALEEDQADRYTGEPLSKWTPATQPSMAKNEDPNESRAVFVDECSCIGCKQCVWLAPATFRIEDEYGRSRVLTQWLDTEENLQAAIDSCPVSCIHWVERADLAPLEYVMQHKIKKRVNVGLMMGGQGGPMEDVFQATVAFMRERQRKEEERARARKTTPAQDAARREAADQLRRHSQPFWSNISEAFASAVSGVAPKAGGGESSSRVGQRKRKTRWDVRQAWESGDGWSTSGSDTETDGEGDAYMSRDGTIMTRGGRGGRRVPLERALVPANVYSPGPR